MNEHEKWAMLVRGAEERMREKQLAEACRLARIGVRTVQSRERTADTARRRAVVAWILWTSADWKQHEIAARLGTTVRAVKKMVRNR
jgi:hypothetical protein